MTLTMPAPMHKRVAAALLARRMSASELGRKIDRSRSYMSGLLRGRIPPSVEVAGRLAHVLTEIPADELMEWAVMHQLNPADRKRFASKNGPNATPIGVNGAGSRPTRRIGDRPSRSRTDKAKV
jgi:transcriptional regulator with XRE-family HTH domain